MTPLQLGIIGAIILAVVGMIVALVVANRNEERNRAMSVIRGAGFEQKTANKGDLQNKRRAELAQKLKDGGGPKKEGGGLKEKIIQAGMTVSIRKFWIYSTIFAVVFTGIYIAMGLAPLATPLVFITALLGLPRMLLKNKAARRQKKFLSEFADALEAMVRLLKAGMPVAEAVAMVSREFTGPVGEEMSKIYDSQKVGVPLHEAALDATKRMPLAEMQMFATGLAIQAQTGASLSEILTNLANVIRARFRLKRKIKSLSSEAKASAMIIGALPVFVSSGIYLINPEYMAPLFNEPFGKVLLGGAIFWMCCGILMMKVMINFKV